LLVHLLAGLVRLLDVLHALVGDAGDVHVRPDGAPFLPVVALVAAFTVCRGRSGRSSRSALSSALALLFLGRGRVARWHRRAAVVLFGRRHLRDETSRNGAIFEQAECFQVGGKGGRGIEIRDGGCIAYRMAMGNQASNQASAALVGTVVWRCKRSHAPVDIF